MVIVVPLIELSARDDTKSAYKGIVKAVGPTKNLS